MLFKNLLASSTSEPKSEANKISMSSKARPENDVHSTTLPTSSSARDGAVVECRYLPASITPLPPEEGEARGANCTSLNQADKKYKMSQEAPAAATNVTPVSISSETQVLIPEDIIDPRHIDQILSKVMLMKEARMIWIKSMMVETKKMLDLFDSIEITDSRALTGPLQFPKQPQD